MYDVHISWTIERKWNIAATVAPKNEHQWTLATIEGQYCLSIDIVGNQRLGGDQHDMRLL